jgi:oxidase EvaA
MNVKNEFFISSISKQGCYIETASVLEWIIEKQKNVSINIEQIEFGKLKKWSYKNGSIIHETGRFFSIDGINVLSKTDEIKIWEQPIINQPEIGYLGFITKKINGLLHFMLQAKIEPGNINLVQLSPTLQATKSNYTKVHNGNTPMYLEYFLNATKDQILVDQLQSEQGARFYRKRNRNIIILIQEDIKLHDNFMWLTLAQIKELMTYDNVINMDTRTVISGINFDTLDIQDLNRIYCFSDVLKDKKFRYQFLKSAVYKTNQYNDFDKIISFLTNLKSIYELNIRKIDLKEMRNWVFTEKSISHEEKKYFEVIPFNIEISNREVISWTQPMIRPLQEGLCAFVCKEINGIIHFIVQAKIECGNHDIVEFAPTVQCLTGNYKETPVGSLPFLDYVLNAIPESIVYDTMQSEEGGRFYNEQNRNMIVLDLNFLPIQLPDNYVWMTLNQIFEFIRFNNFFNIQARSLISAIQYV